jgi:hypothetical protein
MKPGGGGGARCLLYRTQTLYLRAADKRTDTQINGEHREKRETEERSKERPETQLKGDPSSRCKEEPGSHRETTSEGPSTL